MRQTIGILLMLFWVTVIAGLFFPFESEAMIYVSNSNNGNVTVFPLNAENDVAPTDTISYSGVPTPPALVTPAGIAVDANWIYVVERSSASIFVFPIDATGDTEPARIIRGIATTLQFPVGIAVDADWIYVTDRSSPPRVMVFPIDADDNVAPDHIISGSNTTFVDPSAIAVDASWIYVTDTTGLSRIDVFPIDGSDNIAPTREIVASGSSLLGTPTGIAVDANWIYVINNAFNSINVFPIDADEPGASFVRQIIGGSTGLNNALGITVDANWIYATNGNNSITVYPILGDGDITPTRTISGGLTTLNRPYGIVVRSDSATAVPTITQWGMIVFMVLAGLGAVYYLRRKKAIKS